MQVSLKLIRSVAKLSYFDFCLMVGEARRVEQV